MLHAAPAGANGRFPRAERVIEAPGNPRRLLLAGTYGILTTADRGESWYHICEASFSLQDGYQGDPILDWTSEGNLLVGVQASINLSRDDGCQWDQALARPSTFVIDHAFSKSEPRTVFALVASSSEPGRLVYGLERSLDDGASWSPAGAPLPIDIGYSIDIDPTDPEHLLVTGLSADVGQLVVSADGGATWTATPIPDTDGSRPPFLASLHPLDPNRIFVRTNAWLPDGPDLVASDSLLYSSDGGGSWTEAFHANAKLFGFALSPDGQTVLIGYGDPRESASEIARGPFGVYKSGTDRFSFEQVYSGPVACLAWTASGVYVCGSPQEGFELAFAPNADLTLDGGCLTPLLRLDQVRGPAVCGPGTTGSVCGDNWPFACATFGACQHTGLPGARCVGAEPGGIPDSGAPDGSEPPATAGSGSGCSCSLPRNQRRGGELVLSLLEAAFGYAIRRRAQPRHRSDRRSL